jgi:hypothetical protein
MSTTKELFTSCNPNFQTIEFWATQKDGVVYENINNYEWIEQQLSSMNTTEDYVKSFIWNPTSIGNIAYLALYSPTDTQRNKCSDIFNVAKNLLQNE